MNLGQWIDCYWPWNGQKTTGLLMILGRIEVNQFQLKIETVLAIEPLHVSKRFSTAPRILILKHGPEWQRQRKWNVYPEVKDAEDSLLSQQAWKVKMRVDKNRTI